MHFCADQGEGGGGLTRGEGGGGREQEGWPGGRGKEEGWPLLKDSLLLQ